MIARATSGDITWFMAAVNRIADILDEDGDTDPIEIRRSRAIGILAQPARALQLIAGHVRPDADWPGRVEPSSVEDVHPAPYGRTGH